MFYSFSGRLNASSPLRTSLERGLLMPSNSIQYLVFDVESVADGDLVARVRYPEDHLSATEAVARYRGELMEKYNSDFIPYTFQVPISVVAGKVDASYRLVEIVALDEPEFRPHVITRHFWQGWEAYQQPTLVSFNGRTFDLPLLELAAFRYGLSVPRWFAPGARSYEQPRNRYNTSSHLDLMEVLTNSGASRFNGGLNLAANLLGKPGKMDVQGSMVQDLYEQGSLQEINDYCRCDVLDTYFTFLRASVMLGNLALEQEQEIVLETKQWLESEASEKPVYQRYLSHWGDWKNPWSQS
jgi:predicted PolB exonuclease-like 3'-5' exonuclease